MSHGLAFGRPMPIEFTDGPNNDAFGRHRVAQPASLFSSQFQYDAEPLQYEAIVSQSAAGTAPTVLHSADTRLVTMTIAANAAEAKLAAVQSYQFIPYQPGKSQRVFITGIVGAAVSGATKRIGYFNATHSAGVSTIGNGVYFRQDGDGTLNWCISSRVSGSLVTEAVAQSSWNLDRLDGAGTSGVTLDITKPQIFAIDLQYLGMGRVRVGVDVGGALIYCHEFLCANEDSTGPYMQTGTLPIRCEVSGTNVAASIAMKCADVTSEGGIDTPFYNQFSANSTIAAVAVVASGTATPRVILGLRPKTTFNSISYNRSWVALVGASLFCPAAVASNNIFWQIIVGGTLGGTLTWADANATYSGMQFAVPNSLPVHNNDGIVIASGYMTAAVGGAASVLFSAADSIKYPLTLDANGAVRASGNLYLVAKSTSTGTPTVLGSLTWREAR